jgi:UDP-N-acetylglucosamine 2-epimerase
MGTNVIAGTNKDAIINAATGQLKNFKNTRIKKRIPHLWDGNAAGRIVNILAKEMSTKSLK